MLKPFVMNLQRFAEGEDATYTIGDQEYTADQIRQALADAENYKKLEKQHTKVSQEKSELEKKSADLQKFYEDWGDFASQVTSNPALANAIVETWNNVAQGNVTQSDENVLQRGIRAAQRKGDDDAVKELKDQLDEVRGQLAQQEFERTFEDIESRAESDDLEGFTLDGFKEFADTWLEDELGIGDDDDVTPKHLRQAYTAYKAHLLEEKLKRDRNPSLRSNSSGSSGVSKTDRPKGLKALSAAADEFLRGSRR